ncbi:MAG: tRNA (adenosine(37)-N6)-dimethylallyltransferase MiaA [Clostridiales bacterium]|nr:tRNA (adenosine(37)-N6)-dimethylallyltransferase MiaA [Clostridiales bacterium]
MENNKIVAVVGPTASGKTALAVEIAKRYNGEVVSADSMQIYRGMDIASAKPKDEQTQGVIHHLISVKDNDERYSVANFVSDAKKICIDIIERNKLPVLCGGTGLYIDSFVNNLEFVDDGFSDDIRNKLLSRLENEGADALYNELYSIDQEYASKLDKNNTKRVIRALELYYNTGKTMTEQLLLSRRNEKEFDVLYIGLNYRDRAKLYERINKRVDKMLSDGLVEEAKQFLSLNDTKTANQAIGIKELKPFFNGEISLEEAVEKIKQETRRYAKRQLTWFNRNESIKWIYADETENVGDKAFSYIDEFLRGRNN